MENYDYISRTGSKAWFIVLIIILHSTFSILHFPFYIFHSTLYTLRVAFPYIVNNRLWHRLAEKARDEHHHKTANHSYGTAVDR